MAGAYRGSWSASLLMLAVQFAFLSRRADWRLHPEAGHKRRPQQEEAARVVRSSWKGVIGAGVILALAACSSGRSPSASSSAGTGASQSAAASPVATVPDAELSFPGKPVVCIDIPYPPQEIFDEQGNPTGADPDLATEIATRLGLQVQIENSVFDTIIAAVTSGKCDIIISAQNITTDRLEQVEHDSLLPGRAGIRGGQGQSRRDHARHWTCAASRSPQRPGRPRSITSTATGDYEGHRGLNKQCTDAGKPAVDMQEFQKDDRRPAGPRRRPGRRVLRRLADRRLLRRPAARPVRAVGM